MSRSSINACTRWYDSFSACCECAGDDTWPSRANVIDVAPLFAFSATIRLDATPQERNRLLEPSTTRHPAVHAASLVAPAFNIVLALRLIASLLAYWSAEKRSY